MAIIFTAAYLEEVSGAEADTRLITYDDDYAPYSLRAPLVSFSRFSIAIPDNDPAEELWFHGRCFVGGDYRGNSLTNDFCFRTLAGNIVVMVGNSINNSVMGMRLPNNTAEAIATPSDTILNITGRVMRGVAYTWDVCFKQNGTQHSLDFYIDGGLVGSISRDRTLFEAIRAIELGHFSIISNASNSGPAFWSEIIVASGESTLGLRLNSGLPTGDADHNTTDAGIWTDLRANNPEQSVYSATVDALIDGEFDNPDLASGINGIRAVSLKTISYNPGTNLYFDSYVRGDGGIYGDVPLEDRQPSSLVHLQKFWGENPDTEAPWTIAEANALVAGAIVRDPFSGIPVASRWRVRVLTHQGVYIGVNEIEFRTAKEAAEPATGGYPFAGSSYTGFTPLTAFNGVRDSEYWCSAGLGPNHIGYDFINMKRVTQVAISVSRSTYVPYTFVIQKSNDGVLWEDVTGIITAGPWTTNVFQTFDLDAHPVS